MKEGITSRVGRIIAGGANRLVDMLENSAPEMVLGEAVREIDNALYEVRSELGKVAAKKHLITSRLREKNRKQEDLSSKAELAIKQGREDLAEAAVAAQLDIEAQIPVLENTIRQCSESEKEFEGYIAALQARKREMQEELKVYCKSKSEAGAIKNSGQKPATGISRVEARVTRAESVFDRFLEKSPCRSHTDEMKTQSQLAELEDLSRKSRIQERLTTLKAKLEES